MLAVKRRRKLAAADKSGSMRLRLEAGWQEGKVRCSLHPSHVVADGSGQGALRWADGSLPAQHQPSKPDNNVLKRGRGTRKREARASGVDSGRQWESTRYIPIECSIRYTNVSGFGLRCRSTTSCSPPAVRRTIAAAAGASSAAVRPPRVGVLLDLTSVHESIEAAQRIVAGRIHGVQLPRDAGGREHTLT